MKTTFKTTIVTSALAGLLSGSAALAVTTGGPSAVANHSAGIALPTLADKGTHACKGQNSCKGQGGCKAGEAGCKAKNDCKGKGGCATDGSKK